MFKVGDKVIGISNQYVITSTGWKGVVVQILDEDDIEVEGIDEFEEKSERESTYRVSSLSFELLEVVCLTKSYV